MARTSGRRTTAFTLIELLVVMGLMAFITTIVMSGAFGMSRASYYTAAQDLVYNVMQMAHQHACIDGQDVYVVFKDDRTFTVIQGSGRVGSDFKDGLFVDNSAKLPTHDNNDIEVYNLTTGGSAKLEKIDEETKTDPVPEVQAVYDGDGNPTRRTFDVIRDFDHVVRQIHLSGADGDWKAGNLYGFAIMQDQTLPKGYKFGFNSLGAEPANDAVCFYADGSTGIGKFGTEITKNDKKVTIYVSETIAKEADKAIQVIVDKGSVHVKSVRAKNRE